MKKSVLLLFAIFYSLNCFSQEAVFDYFPKEKDSVINYINIISDKKIKKFGDNYSKKIKENILERKKNFINKIEDSTFIFNNKINSYVNTLLKNIYSYNAEIKKEDFYFFINKSPIPNASCYGNGIFSINLGLFNFVNSDDELAFILCHEIGHFSLEHNDKSLLKYFETINSKETKKKISQVKRKEYGKRKAYSDLMEELSYDFLKRSRKVEFEADSIGLYYFKNTKYNIEASSSSLKNLELSDSLIFNQDSRIKEHFNFKNYPFKDSWILKEEVLFDISQTSDDYAFNNDSLKSHPDIPLRIERLNRLIDSKNKILNTTETNNVKLDEIKKIVALISIKNFIDNNKIDLAMYQCLVLYNENEIDKKTYVETVSYLLQKIYEFKDNHTFGRYVGQISPFSNEKHLNEVKQFLHNLELKNIRKIGLNFCLENDDLMKDNPQFKNTLEYFKKLNP